MVYSRRTEWLGWACHAFAPEFLYAPVAQGIEHRIPNPGAAGSIPAWSTNNFNGLRLLVLAHFSFGDIVLEKLPSQTGSILSRFFYFGPGVRPLFCRLALDLEPAPGLQFSVEYARKRGSSAIGHSLRRSARGETPGLACGLPPRKAAPAIPAITMTTRLSCRRATWVSRDASFMFFFPLSGSQALCHRLPVYETGGLWYSEVSISKRGRL